MSKKCLIIDDDPGQMRSVVKFLKDRFSDEIEIKTYQPSRPLDIPQEEELRNFDIILADVGLYGDRNAMKNRTRAIMNDSQPRPYIILYTSAFGVEVEPKKDCDDFFTLMSYLDLKDLKEKLNKVFEEG